MADIFGLEYFDYLWFYLPSDIKAFIFILLASLIVLAIKRAFLT